MIPRVLDSMQCDFNSIWQGSAECNKRGAVCTINTSPGCGKSGEMPPIAYSDPAGSKPKQLDKDPEKSENCITRPDAKKDSPETGEVGGPL